MSGLALNGADLVSDMRAAGCSLDQIEAVLRAQQARVKAAEDEKRDRAREGNRERQARFRASRNADNAVTAVNNDHNAVTENAQKPAPLVRAFSIGEVVNIPPEKPTASTPKGDKPKSEPRNRGTRLPDGWTPSDENRQWAVETLGSNSAARAELSKFSDYWHAKAGAKALHADWDSAWRYWVRNAHERQPRPPPNGRASARNGQHSPMTNALKEIYDDSSDGSAEAYAEPSWPDASSGIGRFGGGVGGAR